MEETIKECKRIIEAYNKTDSLSLRIDFMDSLATQLVFLEEELGKATVLSLKSSADKKTAITRKFLTHKTDNRGSDTICLETARDDCRELIYSEIDREGAFKSLRYFVEGIKTKIDTMRSRISYDKWEANRLQPNEL